MRKVDMLAIPLFPWATPEGSRRIRINGFSVKTYDADSSVKDERPLGIRALERFTQFYRITGVRRKNPQNRHRRHIFSKLYPRPGPR